MIYMFLSNNPSSGDINSSNLSCFIWPYVQCSLSGSLEIVNILLLSLFSFVYVSKIY